MENNNGDRWPPWETPEVTGNSGNESDKNPLIFTC